MKSELLFYAMSGKYRDYDIGVPAFPIATRYNTGSEYTHLDCWEAIKDAKEFFNILGLKMALCEGFWIAVSKYEESDIDVFNGEDWNHLIDYDNDFIPATLEDFSDFMLPEMSTMNKKIPLKWTLKWRLI